MERYDGPLFDCDNHYYEAEDAFMRHVPKRMQKRCVQWVEMNGKRRHLVAGKLNHAVGNQTSTRSRSRACCASTTRATRRARASSS